MDPMTGFTALATLFHEHAIGAQLQLEQNVCDWLQRPESSSLHQKASDECAFCHSFRSANVFRRRVTSANLLAAESWQAADTRGESLRLTDAGLYVVVFHALRRDSHERVADLDYSGPQQRLWQGERLGTLPVDLWAPVPNHQLIQPPSADLYHLAQRSQIQWNWLRAERERRSVFVFTSVAEANIKGHEDDDTSFRIAGDVLDRIERAQVDARAVGDRYVESLQSFRDWAVRFLVPEETAA